MPKILVVRLSLWHEKLKVVFKALIHFTYGFGSINRIWMPIIKSISQTLQLFLVEKHCSDWHDVGLFIKALLKAGRRVGKHYY